jgi:hypothetical protein
MSVALASVDLGNLGAGLTGAYLFPVNNAFITSNASSIAEPAHLRVINDSKYGLNMSTIQAGYSFWLPAGQSIVIPLSPGETGLSYIVFYDLGDLNKNNLLCTYYAPGEPVPPMETTRIDESYLASLYPSSAIPQTGDSGIQANATATASITSDTSHFAYLAGFHITGSGATAGLPVTVTVTGAKSGTLHYVYSAAAGVLVENTPLIIAYDPPLKATAVNTSITVSCPALGSGNTANSVVVYGFRL